MFRKCLSFQGEEVYKMLMLGKPYIPLVSKCRESTSSDPKVWCFDVTDQDYDKFLTGELFERFRCEMSLDQDSGLENYYMFELCIDRKRLSWSDEHNACSFVFVFDTLYLQDIIAVYKVRQTVHWYYKSFEIVHLFKEHPLFPGGINNRDNGLWLKYLESTQSKDADVELKRLRDKYGVSTFTEVISCLEKYELKFNN